MPKKLPRRKRLERELDQLVREYCRLRDKMKCVKCGKGGKLDCSHVIPRTFKRLRWSPDNVKLLCFQCHVWWHENPAESGIWFRLYFNKRWCRLEHEKKRGLKKWSIAEMEELKDWYIREIENDR